MTQEEAVKKIEAEFASMTSKQRTVLWHTIAELYSTACDAGRKMGRLEHDSAPVRYADTRQEWEKTRDASS